MKKYVITSLLILVPFVSMAADHCTDPSEYTIDKRCYVTDEQKKEKPYNAVVGLIDWDSPYCTGTIVKAKNGNPYLYTAKHCTDDGKGSVRPDLRIKLQNNKEFTVTKNNVGNYDITNDKNFSGDWAIYALDPKYYKDVPMVDKSSRPKAGTFIPNIPYKARAVGYGSLKIMSDKEILYFKSKYITYLKDVKGIESNGSEAAYGFYNGGVNAYTGDKGNAYVINFIKYYGDYWNRLLDRKLKVSSCFYTSGNREIKCQAWGGNSGGPIFDNNGDIMGIQTRAKRNIGGENHAGSTASVSLLE